MTVNEITQIETGSAEMAVLQFFIGGGKILPSDFRQLTGFGCKQPDGTYRGMKEFRLHFWALSNKARPLDTLYEQIPELERLDEGMDIQNLVIETLLKYGSKSKMIKAFCECCPEPEDVEKTYVDPNKGDLDLRLLEIGLKTDEQIKSALISRPPHFFTSFPGDLSQMELKLLQNIYEVPGYEQKSTNQ